MGAAQNSGENMVYHKMIAALASPDIAVQRTACDALIADANRSAIVSELTRLIPTTTGTQLLNAIKVLGELADVSSMDILLTMLEHPNKIVRMKAIRALKQFTSPKVTHALLRQLDREDAMVQLTIIDCLNCDNDSELCYETLIRLLHETPSSNLRYMIIRALGNLGEPRAIEHIRMYLNDDDHHVAEDAHIALKKLNSETV